MTSHLPHLDLRRQTARPPAAAGSPRLRGARVGVCMWVAAALTIGLGLLTPTHASTATAKVSVVEGAEVVIDAGREDGLTETATVTLLREGEPIVHPLTGEVLGMPQEPVGTVRIFEVDARSARGSLVKMYSDPVVGDLAEFEPKMMAAPAAPAPEVAAVKERVEELTQSVAEYQRRSEQRTGSYPEFARRVLDEIGAMKSYLVSLDERMVELEEQQNEHHFRLSSVLSGEYRQEDMKEFTIRYAPDTQVRLRAAGKTLMIDVVADSLRMTPVQGEPVALAAETESDKPGLLGLLGFGSDEEEEMPPEPMTRPASDTSMTDEGELWYISTYHLAAGVGLILALLIMVFLVIKRRYADVMDGLEDFDDDEYESYLDDDEEDEDED